MHLVVLQLWFRRKFSGPRKLRLGWKVVGVFPPAARASILSCPRRSPDSSRGLGDPPEPCGFPPGAGLGCHMHLRNPSSCANQKSQKLERVIVCEWVNIQYKRLGQLSGANPQAQLRVSDFIWQLAASEDSSPLKPLSWGGREEPCASGTPPRCVTLEPVSTGSPGRTRARAASVSPQLPSLISFHV